MTMIEYKKQKSKIFNVFLMIAVVAGIFAFAETAYFGYNWTPKSSAEWVCDSIVGVAMGINMFIAFKRLHKLTKRRDEEKDENKEIDKI